MYYALTFVISYLLGAINFSYLFTKIIKKDDIRNYGSGNAGATNTMRVLGTGPAVGVLILDVVKGIAGVLIAMAFGLPNWGLAVAGLCAVIGHVWPIYFGFRGGKGVATTIGVFCMLFIIPALIAGAVAIILIAATRFVSLGSLVFIILTPVIGWIYGTYPPASLIVGAVIALVLIWKHRSNIGRLVKGTENKLGTKTKNV
ncbi:glycerol-3-phosphate 1-O-acyltransferase PlsY [Camelliibacillus cellulosilyticus]|uniref:Glycerol-3-phosphate acyltransferase n=1 Tax=Camelliibacillus cellulosilyticus TaxID=2174486 RepID=A0ABV9GLT3_9BACL